jgi:hypothetical protein
MGYVIFELISSPRNCQISDYVYFSQPAFYTPNLLQYLDQQNLKSTFFVIGSRAISNPATLQLEYMAGHQIGVHTWSHPSLTTLTNEEIIAELGWGKKIIKDVLGVTPVRCSPFLLDAAFCFTDFFFCFCFCFTESNEAALWRYRVRFCPSVKVIRV